MAKKVMIIELAIKGQKPKCPLMGFHEELKSKVNKLSELISVHDLVNNPIPIITGIDKTITSENIIQPE